MRVRLLKQARITHEAGEIVEVSPAQVGFLLSIGAAEIVELRETPEKPKRATRVKK